MAHEYRLTVWRATHHDATDFSLLEHLVFEGRVDSFPALVVPGRAPGGTTGPTRAQKRTLWRQLQPHVAGRERPQVLAFMVGDAEQGISPSAGYIPGHRLAQAYLRRHPEAPVADWTALSAGELRTRAPTTRKRPVPFSTPTTAMWQPLMWRGVRG